MSLVKTALRQPQRQTQNSSSNANNSTDPSTSSSSPLDNYPPRVLFLLATVNADKKPKPADFEDRLVMMTLMAEHLRSSFDEANTSTPTTASNPNSSPPSSNAPIIDIGITKEPYFIDKAACIDESNIYHPLPENDRGTDGHGGGSGVIEQIHLTGFDTLIRIFTPKYYPNHTPPLSALAPFLSRHRVRATVRVDADSPSPNLKDAQAESGAGFDTVEGQIAYVDRIARGELEAQGLKREWAKRVELVVDDSGEAEGVSSTRVREAAKAGRFDEVEVLVGKRVAEWIRERGLYQQ